MLIVGGGQWAGLAWGRVRGGRVVVGKKCGESGCKRGSGSAIDCDADPGGDAVFLFLYFLKIKISKIYVRFEIFQKYPPVDPHRATGLKCKFFFQIRNEVPGEKKGPVARWGGDRPFL